MSDTVSTTTPNKASDNAREVAGDAPVAAVSQMKIQEDGASKEEDNESLPVTLYVGELAHSVTEAILYDIFSTVSSVSSIRVCRDAVTYESLGYAYVNFNSHADATRALQELNYAQIKGKQCRIMWSQRDPSVRKSGDGNIFIKNLDPSIDNKALHDTFIAFGEILSCKIVTDRAGNSLGFGFIHFYKSESAKEAIETVNGMNMNGQTVFVGRHISREEREAESAERRAQFTNVYINNLSPNMDEAKLTEMFSKFGEIKTLKLVTPDDDKNKSFGLIDFVDHESAQKAVASLNDTEVDGVKVYVARAQSKGERRKELQKKYEKSRSELLNKYQGTNLYIKNLDDTVDNEKLQEIFAPIGTIISARVMLDQNGKSRGFGFVSFTTPEEANKAITEMNGQIVSGKPLYVVLAQRKEIRHSQMKQHFNAQRQLNMKQQAAASGQLPFVMRPGYIGQQPNQGVPMPMPMQQLWPQRGAPPQMWGRQGSGATPAAQAAAQAAAAQAANPAAAVPAGKGAAPAGSAVPAAATQPFPANEPIDKFIETLPEDQKKQVIGEALFPRILQQENNDAQLASKITGMLLDMDNADLLQLVRDENMLKEHVLEAHAAYMAFLEGETKN